VAQIGAFACIAVGLTVWGALLGWLYNGIRRHRFYKKTLAEQYEIAKKELGDATPSC